MKLARGILIAFGIAMLGAGAFYLLADVAPNNYVGILLWFAGALIIHDGIIAPIVFGISVLMRKSGRRIPFGVLVIVQGTLVVAAVMTAIVVPEILKKGIGTANPTLLPLDYSRNLALFYAALVVVAAAAIAGYLRVASRAKLRPPSSHD